MGGTACGYEIPIMNGGGRLALGSATNRTDQERGWTIVCKAFRPFLYQFLHASDVFN